MTCKASDLQNAGSPGERGFQFQDLTKKCPAFAVELAALGLRHVKSHWGPILRREAEVLPSSEELFIEVEEAIESASPRSCGSKGPGGRAFTDGRAPRLSRFLRQEG